eukprot:1133575-Pelagomonas_calceolata.AAC.3
MVLYQAWCNGTSRNFSHACVCLQGTSTWQNAAYYLADKQKHKAALITYRPGAHPASSHDRGGTCGSNTSLCKDVRMDKATHLGYAAELRIRGLAARAVAGKEVNGHTLPIGF